jgi:hypothetical protein
MSVVSVQSFGANGISEVIPDTEYDADYPPSGSTGLVVPNDYGVSLSSVTVQLDQPITNAPLNLVLRLYRINDGAIEDPPLESGEVIANLGQQTLLFSVTEGLPHFMGSYAALVLCESLVIYDGDCDSPHNNTQPYYFTLVPRGQLPTIPWNIQ